MRYRARTLGVARSKVQTTVTNYGERIRGGWLRPDELVHLFEHRDKKEFFDHGDVKLAYDRCRIGEIYPRWVWWRVK